MSYMRYNHPLRWFRGESASYVFSGEDNRIEDYHDTYSDTCSFVELVGQIVYRETKDATYADKIVRTLAKKLHIYHNLRVDVPLTGEQVRGFSPVIDTELYIPEKAILDGFIATFRVNVHPEDREDVAEYMRFYPDVVEKTTELLGLVHDKFPEALTLIRLMPHDADCIILELVMPSYPENFHTLLEDPRFYVCGDGGGVFVTTNWRPMETVA